MDSVSFDFYFLNHKGQRRSGPHEGELTPTNLFLDNERIPLTSILRVNSGYQHLLVQHRVTDNLVRVPVEVIEILNGFAHELKDQLDIHCSQRQLEHREDELTARGQEECLRVVKCPWCYIEIDLSAFHVTREVYCPFCERISNQQPKLRRKTEDMRICQHCGYYSLPCTFQFLFFLFLVHYLYASVTTTERCRTCMRKPAWGMLAVSLVGFLVIPLALWQLFRAYCTNPLRGGYRPLDRANRAARAGRTQQAEAVYTSILKHEPQLAGIHYNRAIAYCEVQRWDEARMAAEEALASCANFVPAWNILVRALDMLDDGVTRETTIRGWNQMPLDNFGLTVMDD